jgi:putative ATP-dependent endonuclease of OLD family
MKLHSLKIEGFRRIKNAEIQFGETTFLIGANNSGKSSVLRAIKSLLSVDKRLDSADFFSVIDEETGETKMETGKVVLEATFHNVPEEASTWRGFKGRIATYALTNEEDAEPDTGLAITYRKTYEPTADVVVEMLSKKRTMKPEFASARTGQMLVDAGAPTATVLSVFDNLEKKFKEDDVRLVELDEIWNFEDTTAWEKNPGGIPGVVISKLPIFLLIPADCGDHEIHSKSGVLSVTLNELFEDVRGVSENYRMAQQHLMLLAKELDPSDHESEFGKMLLELNGIVGGVFTDSKLYATADLSGPGNLKPSFSIEMSSNVRTPVTHQGTGMVRSAVFGVLRYRQQWLARKSGITGRSLVIGFEEPELFLHPSAANQMRDLIYDLSRGNSQIIATSHSPQMIDLSRKPRQIINRFNFETSENLVTTTVFNVSQAFANLQGDDKDYVKMLLKIDDHIARVFFTKQAVIVEGDTEDIVIRETLTRLNAEQRQRIRANFEVIKARGKASIIGLAKYLVTMGIVPTIIHDRDATTPGAEVFNDPIASAAGGGLVIPLEECLEDILGYSPPSSDKPFKAYKKTTEWGANWDDVPEGWKTVLTKVFGDHVPVATAVEQLRQ